MRLNKIAVRNPQIGAEGVEDQIVSVDEDALSGHGAKRGPDICAAPPTAGESAGLGALIQPAHPILRPTKRSEQPFRRI